jgi:WD40 repeat protein
VLRGRGASGIRVLAFSRDGETLAAAVYEGGIRTWSLAGGPARDLWKPASGLECIALDPLGRFVVAGTRDDGAWVVSLQDGSARRLRGGPAGGWVSYVAVSSEGRWAAGVVQEGAVTALRVWDLEAGTSRLLENSQGCVDVAMDGEEGVVAGNLRRGDIRRWDLSTGRSSVLATGRAGVFKVVPTRDGKILFSASVVDTVALSIEVVRDDLVPGTSRPIVTHGNQVARSRTSPSMRTGSTWPPGIWRA